MTPAFLWRRRRQFKVQRRLRVWSHPEHPKTFIFRSGQKASECERIRGNFQFHEPHRIFRGAP